MDQGSMDEVRQLDTDFEASTLSRPHLSQDSARDLGLSPSGGRFRLTADPGRALVRFLVAIAVSAVLCLLLYRFAATSRIGPTDIVTYPTFANFNPKPAAAETFAACRIAARSAWLSVYGSTPSLR